jgi:multidrug efflux pump subunit AcrA (membrane-fusion protein)
MWTRPTWGPSKWARRPASPSAPTRGASTRRRSPASAYGSTITDNVVTYLTYLDVDNADLSLRPGMTATATITATERKDVLLVPNSALRFEPTPPMLGNRSAAKGGVLPA